MSRSASLAPLALVLLAACTHNFARSPSERPGLGTTWGETRQSHVRSVPFERDDPGRPSALAVLHYDDREGLRAQALFADDGGGALVGDGALRVRLLDGWGAPLPLFRQGARQYVEGQEGQRYLIEIENRSPSRIEAVATVDGLDVLDGERGSFQKRGYLVDPWATLRIEGFRRSLEEVAAFRFGAVADSYAAQKGDDGDVGVIGVAFFAERGSGQAFLDGEARRRRAANPFPDGFAAPPRRGW
jgi:hypothetical protein